MQRSFQVARLPGLGKAMIAAQILGATMAFASDEGSERKITFAKAFQFCDHFSDCGMEFNLGLAVRAGGASFDRREVLPLKERGSRFKTVGVLSGDRKVFRYEEREIIASKPESKTDINRWMIANNRQATVTFRFSENTPPIMFSEDKQRESDLDGFLANLGDPLLFGSLELNDLTGVQPSPDVRQLDNLADVEYAKDGISARYGGWHIEVRFDPKMPGLPHAISTTNHQRPMRNEGYTKSRHWLIHDWFEHDGVKIPKRVQKWTLWIDLQEKLHTTYQLIELQSLGPKQKVSDRYGDHFTDIPNGTRVDVKDYEGIEFIWQDGEIVRKIDKVKLATMVGKRFFPSPFRRFVLMGFGGIALLALGWVIWHWSRGGGGFKTPGFEK